MTKHALEHTKVPVQHFDSGGNVSAQNIGAAAGAGAAGIPGALAGGLAGNTGALGNGGGLSFGDQGLTGGISDFLGLTDKFNAGSANIQAGTNQDQLNNAYTGAQTGLATQNNLTNTLQPGVGQAASNQAALAGQLANQANGVGPNVARAQLNQTTGQNAAAQAALMAGQRGTSANPGLIARQAAQQGANLQQQAVGQGATLEAQQQIAAQNNLANLSNNQINQGQTAASNQNSAQQGEQNVLQNANTAANNAAVNMQSNINNTNAQTAIANQNSNNGLFGSLSSAAGGLAGLFADGGEVPLNDPGQMTVPDASKKSGPDLSSLASVAMVAAANGGEIPQAHLAMLAGGGQLAPTSVQTASSMPQSFVANWLGGGPSMVDLKDPGGQSQIQSTAKPVDFAGMMPAQTPKTKGSAGVLPGAGYVDADNKPAGTWNVSASNQDYPDTIAAAKGGKMQLPPQAKNIGGKLKPGGKVPGKPAVKGAVNSYKNDDIAARLSPGEIVLPREVTQSKNAPAMAAAFVRKIQAKKGLK